MVTKVKKSTFNSQDNLGVVSLTDYLAIGDGVTDNTAQILAAIAAAIAAGYPLLVPAGVFITSPITMPSNLFILGDGDNSVLKLKSGSTAALLTANANCRITNLKLDGNKSAVSGSSVHGVAITSIANVKVVRATIINTLGDGINITGTITDNVVVHSCSITGFTRNGISWEAGTNVRIFDNSIRDSDVVASPGIGLSVSSTGNVVKSGIVTHCYSNNNAGGGYAFAGNGSKNVTNISVVGCFAVGNIGNGFRISTAERVILSGCVATNNTIDGYRLEGDVQNTRLVTCVADTNTSFGIREVVAGATPNYNGFLHCVVTGNGNNTITKVGANSTILSI